MTDTDIETADIVLTAYRTTNLPSATLNRLGLKIPKDQLLGAGWTLSKHGLLEYIKEQGSGDFPCFKIIGDGLSIPEGGLKQYLDNKRQDIMNTATIKVDNLHIGDSIHSSSFRDFKPINNPTNPDTTIATNETKSSWLTDIWQTISHNPLISAIISGLILWLITLLF